jgi:hypothetical protein
MRPFVAILKQRIYTRNEEVTHRLNTSIMKNFLFVLVFVLLGSIVLEAQSLVGIWHCQSKKECIDFTPDGRFKIFSDKYVKYGRYKVENNKLHLKEIGAENHVSFNLTSSSKAHFILSDDQNNKKRFTYFDQTKMCQKEFKRAIAIYFQRDQYQKRLVSNY